MVVELNGDIEAFSFFLNIFKDIRHLSFPTLKISLVLDFFLGFWHKCGGIVDYFRFIS